jgi:transposase
MYIDTIKTYTKKGKMHVRHLLRRCYREHGKIKHETIANLSHCSEADIQAMKLILKNKHNLAQFNWSNKVEITTGQGKAIGATWLLLNEEALQKEEMFDGCYVIKTDLPQDAATKETIHNCYKDLALVEQAFRSSKTAHLEMRPIYVRLASRTRGHVFVVMLAYRLIKELAKYWHQVNVTVEEGIAALSSLCQIKVEANGQSYSRIPQPDELVKNLLSLASVTPPTTVLEETKNVTTKVKLTSRRKSL